MSILSRLFGAKQSTAEAVPSVEYKGFRISPAPTPEGRGFRIGARIEKDVDGAQKTHNLIRVDTLESREAADEASIGKAKQMIDEQGDRLFG